MISTASEHTESTERERSLAPPSRRSLSMCSFLLFPLDSADSPPTPHPLTLFPSSPISSALIPFFFLSRGAEVRLIGHVCGVTRGPDIIVGQIVCRLASGLSRLSNRQKLTVNANYRLSATTFNWKRVPTRLGVFVCSSEELTADCVQKIHAGP